MDIVTTILNALANAVHIPQSSLVLIVGIVVALANIIGKSIPDTATGALGIVRTVAKTIGLYVPNNTGPAK